MNIFIKSKKSNILFLTFIASITLFSLKKINYESNLINNSIKNPLRSLLDRDDSLTRCEKAEKSLKDLYKEIVYVSEEKEKELDKYQKVLIDFIRNQNLDIAKDYIKRLIIPIIILVIAVICLFFWIGFCGCSCYPCGCCNGTMGGCGKCSFTLSIFFNSIALVICIAFIILFSSYYFQSINNPVCSLYKFTFHLLEGTNGDYSNEKQWHSLDNMNLYIKSIQEVIESINNLKALGNCEKNSVCSEVNTQIEALKDEVNSFTKLSSDVTTVRQKINDLFVSFNDMKEQYLDDINKIMVDYLDKYYKLGLDGLFAVIGVMSLFALIALVASITCNCFCVRIFYHFIWNLQIIIAFIMIIVAACLNVVGVIGKDSIAILQYVKSSENIKSDDPLFIDIDGEASQYLITCLNEDGNLLKYIKISTVPDFPDITGLKKNKETLGKDGGNDDLIKTINNIIDISDKYEKVKNNIGGGNLGNCRFLRSDVDILMVQLKNSLGRDFTFLSYVFLGEGVFIIISIFFGIIVINKYSKVNDSLSEENVKMVEKEVKIKSGAVIRAREKMDSSDIPIKPQV